MRPSYPPIYDIYLETTEERTVCVKDDTPPEILKALMEYDQEYFSVYGRHIYIFK
ncbi:hypothetical protein [Victivallis sp. Marseille-Q1083]|uniref:hypothetical protein n=1 Tax=Victivallis sp. Marseille-Q1083 TaxID=2717288 RepID=UPI00158CFEA4|nr:hypothetical protein [Victivallis sp. Marseille-Q1083]